MMQSTDGIVELVVVEKSELVVNLSAAGTVIQRGFVQVDCTRKVALGSFIIGILC